MDATDSPIARVILRYYPGWDPPEDTGYEWLRCLCPFHGDENPSAAVSYDLQAFNCLACGVKGDVISLIRHEEEVNYSEAHRLAEEISLGCDVPIQRKPPRKPSRRLFSEQGSPKRNTVRPGVRSRPRPWT